MHIDGTQEFPKLQAQQPELISQHQQQAAAEMIFMSGTGEPTNGGDVFDGSAEPIIYMSDNRMPVIIEFNSAIIYIIFAALLLAFLTILPGFRRTKLTSFIGLVTMIIVGASILLAIEGTYWLTGGIQLNQIPYGSLSKDSITGRMSIDVGLSSTNVTLVGQLQSSTIQDNTNETSIGPDSSAQTAHSKTVYYNEQFHWDQPDKMASEHEQALRKGLPYPILTVTEFLSQDSDGFNWMRQLRQAGHFTSLALYASLVSWCLTTVVMCVLPVYLPHMMQITGALMMSAVWIYTLLIQSPNSIAIRLGESAIEFAFGHTYVITFVSGAVSMFAGVLLFLLRMSNPNGQFTIMDSERYLKDQNALYSANLASQSGKWLESDEEKKKPPNEQNQNCVIIPIADIEAQFKPYEHQA